MKVKYLEGPLTIKGLYLPTAVVRCLDISGDEHNGCFMVSLGVFGDLNSSKQEKNFWFDNFQMSLMIEGFENSPTNNIFEYSLQRLKELDSRFANLVLKEFDHTIVFTAPTQPSTDKLITADVAQYNTIGVSN